MRPAQVIQLIRQLVQWAMAAAALLLAAMCVYGAFLGAQRAAALFRSDPLAAFWMVMAAGLVCSPLLLPKMLRHGGLLAAHLGAALILIGAMAGSSRAHRLTGEWLGDGKAPVGVMVIPEGAATATLLDEQTHQPIAMLPFHVALGRFWIDYYPDEPAGAAGPPKNYFSRVAVLKDGKVLREAVVSVNRPLHYGGYHFYQYSYSPEPPPCTVLLAVSDSGLLLVYGGFVLLCGGLAWHMWVAPAADYLSGRREDGRKD